MRLGHVNERGLTELSKQNLFCGHKVGKLQFCENCVLGKSKRIKFTNAKHTTQSNLEYIHSDLWGPARTQTMGGAKYLTTMVDDSHKVWVYLSKSKDKAFETFKTWKQLVENKTKKKIKVLRTNNDLNTCVISLTGFAAMRE